MCQSKIQISTVLLDHPPFILDTQALDQEIPDGVGVRGTLVCIQHCDGSDLHHGHGIRGTVQGHGLTCLDQYCYPLHTKGGMGDTICITATYTYLYQVTSIHCCQYTHITGNITSLLANNITDSNIFTGNIYSPKVTLKSEKYS